MAYGWHHRGTGEGGPGGLKPFQLNVSAVQEVKLQWHDCLPRQQVTTGLPHLLWPKHTLGPSCQSNRAISGQPASGTKLLKQKML